MRQVSCSVGIAGSAVLDNRPADRPVDEDEDNGGQREGHAEDEERIELTVAFRPLFATVVIRFGAVFERNGSALHQLDAREEQTSYPNANNHTLLVGLNPHQQSEGMNDREVSAKK